jgi:hypothetical protein
MTEFITAFRRARRLAAWLVRSAACVAYTATSTNAASSRKSSNLSRFSCSSRRSLSPTVASHSSRRRSSEGVTIWLNNSTAGEPINGTAESAARAKARASSAGPASGGSSSEWKIVTMGIVHVRKLIWQKRNRGHGARNTLRNGVPKMRLRSGDAAQAARNFLRNGIPVGLDSARGRHRFFQTRQRTEESVQRRRTPNSYHRSRPARFG